MRFTIAVAVTTALAGACTSARQGNATTPSDPLTDVDGSALFAEGQRHAQSGDLVRAEQYLVAAIDKGHPSAEVLPVLMEVCIAGDRFDTALSHARPHLLREPQNWSLRYMVATLYSAVGKTPLAIEHLERVLMDAPEEANAHYTLGKLMWQENDNARAVALMERYISLAPKGNHAPDARALLLQWERQEPVAKPKSDDGSEVSP